MSVNRLVLGSLQLCVVPPGDAFRILDAFVESCGRVIDTASLYGTGYAESLIGSWLRRIGAPVRVSTKLGHFEEDAAYQGPDAVRHALETSVERLGVIPDVVLLHEGDWACWWEPGRRVGEVDGTSATRAAPAWAALQTLAEEWGFETGLSGNHAGHLATAAAAVLARNVMVAKQHDLLWRSAEALLERAAADGTCVWAAAPFHQGALLDLASLSVEYQATGDVRFDCEVRKLRSLLAHWRLSVVDVAVPFVLADPRVAHVCVGASSEDEVGALIESASRPLPDALLRALKRLGLARPARPGPAGRAEYRSPPWPWPVPARQP